MQRASEHWCARTAGELATHDSYDRIDSGVVPLVTAGGRYSTAKDQAPKLVVECGLTGSPASESVRFLAAAVIDGGDARDRGGFRPEVRAVNLLRARSRLGEYH